MKQTTKLDTLVTLGLFIAALIMLTIALWTRPAVGHIDTEVLRVSDAIQILQPATSDTLARRWAVIYLDAANETWLDPLLLVAISMRESSLLEEAEAGEYRGQLGEVGLLQVHGVALRHRPAGCDVPLIGAFCQIHTGARFLQYVRELCGGSTWRWVAAYGMSSCPSEATAHEYPGVILAYRYYREVGGEGW